jgi:hypothetical protein
VALALAGWLLVACGGPTSSSEDMAGITGDMASQLTLSVVLLPPTVDGLGPVGGQLELHQLGVFADVSADARTMVPSAEFHLPDDHRDLDFPDAPYGLYSRVGAHFDELSVHTTWRGTPLAVYLEIENLAIDLRGAGVEYGPGQSASLKVQVDESMWFDPVALDAATVDAGQITLDALHNTTAGVAFAKAAQKSFSLLQ